jgi:hypothetical protein
MLEKINNFIFFVVDVNLTPLDYVMGGYMVKILSYWSGQHARASHWLEELADSTLSYLIIQGISMTQEASQSSFIIEKLYCACD